MITTSIPPAPSPRRDGTTYRAPHGPQFRAASLAYLEHVESRVRGVKAFHAKEVAAGRRSAGYASTPATYATLRYLDIAARDIKRGLAREYGRFFILTEPAKIARFGKLLSMLRRSSELAPRLCR